MSTTGEVDGACSCRLLWLVAMTVGEQRHGGMVQAFDKHFQAHASKQQRPHQDESGSRQRFSLFSDSFDNFTLLYTIDILISLCPAFPAYYRCSQPVIIVRLANSLCSVAWRPISRRRLPCPVALVQSINHKHDHLPAHFQARAVPGTCKQVSPS